MAQQIRRGVFIGLGGSGLKVALQLKRLFLERFGEVPAVFRIIVFDTDDERNKEKVFVKGEEVVLETNREFFHLTFSLAGIAKQLDQRPYVSPWFPAEEIESLARDERNIKQGAPKKVRKVGRLAFFEKFSLVTQRINDALDAAKNPNAANEARDLGYVIVNQDEADIDIHIASSVCGGTGAGMLIDVATYIRSVNEHSVASGYLFLPGAFSIAKEDPKNQLKANAFATLIELDHFMNAQDYSMDYGPGRRARVRAKPLPFCYLIDGSKGGTDTLRDPRELSKVVAESIFVWACNPVSGEAETILTSAGNQTDQVVDDRVAAYSGIGVASRFIPRDELLTYCSKRLAQNLLSFVLDPLQKTQRGSVQEVRDLEQQWNIEVERAVEEFLETNTIESLLDRLDQSGQGRRVLADVMIDARQFARIPPEQIGERLNNVYGDRDLDLLPQALKQVRGNRDAALREYALALGRTTSQHADDMDRGPTFVTDFLRLLSTRLDAISDGFGVRHKEAIQARAGLKEQINEQSARIARNAGSWVRWNILNRAIRSSGPSDWASAVNAYLTNEVEIRKLEHVKNIIDTIRGEAASATDVVSIQQLQQKYGQLIGHLRTLEQEFAVHAERVRTGLKERFTIFEEPILDHADFETVYQAQAPSTSELLEKFFRSEGTFPLHQWVDERPETTTNALLSFCEQAFSRVREMTLEDGIELKQERGQDISARSLYDELERAAGHWVEYRKEDLPDDLPDVLEILGVGDRDRSALVGVKSPTTATAATGDSRAALFYHVVHGMTIASLSSIDDYRQAYLRELGPERRQNRRPVHLAPEFEFFKDPALRSRQSDTVHLLALLVGSRIVTTRPSLEGIDVGYQLDSGAEFETIVTGPSEEEALLDGLRALKLRPELQNLLQRHLDEAMSRDAGKSITSTMREYLIQPSSGRGLLTNEIGRRIGQYLERLDSPTRAGAAPGP